MSRSGAAQLLTSWVFVLVFIMYACRRAPAHRRGGSAGLLRLRAAVYPGYKSTTRARAAATILVALPPQPQPAHYPPSNAYLFVSLYRSKGPRKLPLISKHISKIAKMATLYVQHLMANHRTLVVSKADARHHLPPSSPPHHHHYHHHYSPPHPRR
jgi:hypothetical protein